MSLIDRARLAVRNRDTPVWLAALALAATYAASVTLQARRRPAPAAEGASLVALPPAARLRGWPLWKHVLWRTYEEIANDRLLALGAGVVFYGLLALFPAVTALVSSYGLFADPSTIIGHMATLSSFVPATAYEVIDEQVTRIVSHGAGGLSLTFLIGLALALWSANAGMKAVIDALNIAYGVKERRSFIKLNLVSLAFTAGGIVALLLAIAAVIAVPLALSFLRLDGYGPAILVWLRWPGLLVMLLAGLALLYRFGPDLPNPRWRWISPGALFAALSWLAGSALLSLYLGRFADYDATYGSLGAAIALMMWLWMSAIVVLVGAELNSEIDAAQGVLAPAEEKIG